MPCSSRKARILLKENKAKIARYNPFTIQLQYATGETTQPITIGIDTGAKHVGIAIVSEDKILAKGEIELRDGISLSIEKKAALRRNRRNRNTRYRPSRFSNRKRKDGWIPPTVKSKLDATTLWIDRFASLVPSPKLCIEVAKFDIAKMINPEITGIEYQNGNTKGYYDVRYYVFARDGYTCQVCKRRNQTLQTHHIVFRSHGGTDRADNLITVCTNCHTFENHKEGGVLWEWMKKKKKVKDYREATFMNIVRRHILVRYPDAHTTYGSITSPRRKILGLSKTHFNDAIAATGVELIKENSPFHFQYKQFRKKKRSLHESHPRRWKTHKNVNSNISNKNVRFRNGVYLNDQFKYAGAVGWVYGFSGGEKSHEFVLRNANGEIIKSQLRKNSPAVIREHCKFMCHNNGWQYSPIVSDGKEGVILCG